MTKIWDVDALIITDELLRQLNVCDKGDKISFSLCADTGEPRSEIEIDKKDLETLSEWLSCHIKIGKPA